VEGAGYEVLDGLANYREAHDKIQVSCPEPGHRPYSVTVNGFRSGGRCPSCSCNSASRGELEVLEFVRGLGFAAGPDRQILGNRHEIDILVASRSVAIEFDGLYWHSEVRRPDRNYHLRKREAAEGKGLRLLQFFEDEWRQKPAVVQSLIAQALGVPIGKKAMARKCSLKEIDVVTRRKFLDLNHLQGDTRASVCWGLYLGGDLLQVLSLRVAGYLGGTPRWEIARVATRLGHLVVGGLSRLVSRAKTWLREKGVDRLWTFADRRYSTGRSYVAAGFEFLGSTPPGYWYTDFHIRRHRFGLRKTPDCPVGLTEVQWRRSQGWHRIFDVGQLSFCLSWKN
jgi:hypothetical protein